MRLPVPILWGGGQAHIYLLNMCRLFDMIWILKKMRNLLQKFSILLALLLISGCSSNDLIYLDRESLSYDPVFLYEKSQTQNNKNYGAIRVKNMTEDGQLFILKKKSGAYMAETNISKGKRDGKYVSFGLDYKTKLPKVGFRWEF